MSRATAILAALVAGHPMPPRPRPPREGPALPPEPKAATPRVRVRVVRHVVELWEVKAPDKARAKSRALRGVGKRVARSETAAFAKVVEDGAA